MARPETPAEPAVFKGMLQLKPAFFGGRMAPPFVPFRDARRFSSFRNARLKVFLRAGLGHRAMSGNAARLRIRSRRGGSPARVPLALLRGGSLRADQRGRG